MHDERPTSNPAVNADLATPVGPVSEEVPAGTANRDFDPEAFDLAAAQLRPSWDDIPEPEPTPSDIAPSAASAPAVIRQSRGFHGVTLQGNGEVDLPRQVEVVVPRPPRAPRVDTSQLGTSDDDEFNAVRDLVLPKKSKRGRWFGLAVAVFAATLGVALVRGARRDVPQRDVAQVDAPEDAPSFKAPTPEPAAATPVVPAAPTARVEPAIAPVPAEPAAPVALDVAPKSAPEPSRVETSVVQPAPKPQVRERDSESRAERHTKTSRPRESPVERRTSARTAPSKPKRGAGFVSTNPY